MSGVLKSDWSLSWDGDRVSFSGEVKTTHDARRLCTAIRLMSAGLSSHRIAVAADFGIVETPRTYAERVREFLA